MACISGEVMINAPVAEVFDMVADERNEPRYNARIVRAEKVSEGPVGRPARNARLCGGVRGCRCGL
jgi:hypothetical protein